MRIQMQDQITDLQDARLVLQGRAQQDAQPCHQLFIGKGLDEIIVGPGVESQHAVFDAVLGRQQQHRHMRPIGAQLFQYADAVFLRHHDIQHDGVIVCHAQIFQCFFAVMTTVYAVMFLSQFLGDQCIEIAFIICHQYAHDAPSSFIQSDFNTEQGKMAMETSG